MNPIDRLMAARLSLELGRWREAERLLKAPMPAEWEAERRGLIGEALRGQGLLGAALRELRSSLRSAPEDDPAVVVEAALAAAACLRSLGDTIGARRLLAQAEAASRRRRLGGFETPIELEKALVERAEGRWKTAAASLKRMRRRADRPLKAYLDWALGGTYRFEGRLRDAVRAFESSRRLSAAGRDERGVGYAEAGLGGATRVQGRFEDSIRHYRAALAAFEDSEDLFGLAYANCGLANGLRQAGRWPEAERYYRKALGLYRRLEDPADLAYVEWGLGQVLARTGRREEARRLVAASLERFTAAGETRGRVLAMLSLATLEHAAGRTAVAEKLHEAACGLSKRSKIHAHLEAFT